MEKQSPTLTVIGDVGVDLVMGPVGQWPKIGTEIVVDQTELRAGGSAGNSALAAHYLGANCHLLSMVGEDEFGRWLKEQFSEINASLPVSAGPTSLSVGVIHSCGERTFLTTRGHLETLELPNIREELDEKTIPGSIALLSGVFLTPRIRIRYGELIGCLKSRGYQVAIDTGWPPTGWTSDLRKEVLSWLIECDHILLNETELLNLTEEEDLEVAARKLVNLTHSKATIVAKTGPEGAVALEGSIKASCKAHETTVFDTIGAGDSFNTGYLLARIEGKELQEALQAGCDTAADIISCFPRKAIKAGELGKQKNKTNKTAQNRLSA